MAAISESFVCAGADTLWSVAMDIDVVGACANTSDAGANCETGTLGLSTVVSDSDGACSCLLFYGERQLSGT